MEFRRKLKRILSILVVLCMAMGMVPCFSDIVYADSNRIDTWDGTADTSWYDASKAEFEISTAEQLAGLVQLVKETKTVNNIEEKANDFAGKTIKLTSDIDLAGKTWESIGTKYSFNGTFDGQYHTVYNLKANTVHYGLFGVVDQGTIQNVGVENAEIIFQEDDTYFHVGILIDEAYNTNIRNCYTTGKITSNAAGGKFVGGIVGRCYRNSSVIGSYSSAVIESKAVDDSESVSGIVGAWSEGDSAKVLDCYFDGKIIFNGNKNLDDDDIDYGTNTLVGGILSTSFQSVIGITINNCMVATKEITAPSDKFGEDENPGMYLAWLLSTGKPENCWWPVDEREWPSAYNAYFNKIYTNECGTAVTDFKSEAVLQGLKTNASQGVHWVEGINHPTFDWDERNIPANYSDVDNAINKANALTEEYYVDFSEVKVAIDNVDRNKSKKEQAVVDEYATAINNAISALQLKAADYTAVDAAIEKANALNKDEYKDFSAVEAAIDAVVRGKNITEQGDVDAMAKAINDAISALEKKPDIKPGDSDSTQTGDNINMWLWIALIIVAGGGVTGTILYRKKEHAE